MHSNPEHVSSPMPSTTRVCANWSRQTRRGARRHELIRVRPWKSRGTTNSFRRSIAAQVIDHRRSPHVCRGLTVDRGYWQVLGQVCKYEGILHRMVSLGNKGRPINTPEGHTLTRKI